MGGSTACILTTGCSQTCPDRLGNDDQQVYFSVIGLTLLLRLLTYCNVSVTNKFIHIVSICFV